MSFDTDFSIVKLGGMFQKLFANLPKIWPTFGLIIYNHNAWVRLFTDQDAGRPGPLRAREARDGPVQDVRCAARCGLVFAAEAKLAYLLINYIKLRRVRVSDSFTIYRACIF